MSIATPARATIDDLYRVEGKAELINGRIHQKASGEYPTDVAGNIFVGLRAHAKATGVGVAKTDGTGLTVPELSSGRESFSPGAAYFTGPRPAESMRFVDRAPDFAVEVRSENDYGPGAELEMAAKRADYFEAGTLAVWDVDPIAKTVAVYRVDSPAMPVLHYRGKIANAEPAVPGWLMAVDEVFAV